MFCHLQMSDKNTIQSSQSRPGLRNEHPDQHRRISRSAEHADPTASTPPEFRSAIVDRTRSHPFIFLARRAVLRHTDFVARCTVSCARTAPRRRHATERLSSFPAAKFCQRGWKHSEGDGRPTDVSQDFRIYQSM